MNGDPDNSNIIQALTGKAGTLFDPNTGDIETPDERQRGEE
jgi:hypothetical protein